MGAKAVEVVAAGPQTGEFDVNAVGGIGCRCGGSALLDALEPLIRGDFPVHIDGTIGHAATTILGQRVGRQARPDHDAVGRWLARRHTQREGILQVAGAALSGEPDYRKRGKDSPRLEDRASVRLDGHVEVSVSKLS